MSSTGTIVGHPVVTGLRSAVDALDPALLERGWQLGDDEVETAIEAVLELESRAAACRSMLLCEAESRDLKARTRASSLVRWLGDRFRLSRAEAGARVRAAEGISRHPVLRSGLAAGALTGEQAEVLTGVLDTVAVLPGVEEGERVAAGRFLLAQCASLTPRDLVRAGKAVVEALSVTPSVDDPADAAALAREQERAEADAQAGERNVLQVTRRRGRLLAILEPGTIGEAVLERWAAKNGAKRAGCDGFEDTRTRSERLGDALVDLLARAAGTPNPGDSTPGDSTPGDSTPEPLSGPHAQPPEHAPTTPIAPAAVLTVTTTLAGLRAGLVGAGRLETGQTLSAAALRALACDALIVPAVLGQPSEVLDLGRAARDFNRAQRRAAALRDRGCVAPGCDAPPAACHVHHSWWWTNGGPTDLCNAALLCDFHHRMVHRQGWAMGLAPNGYPHLVPPESIDPQQRPRQHHRFLIAGIPVIPDQLEIPDQLDPTQRTGRRRR